MFVLPSKVTCSAIHDERNAFNPDYEFIYETDLADTHQSNLDVKANRSWQLVISMNDHPSLH